MHQCCGQSNPIFIVGAPRSGTTLLAAMLCAHSRLDCGPETFFFARLSKGDAAHLTDPTTWPERALDFLMGLRPLGLDPPAPSVAQAYGIVRGDVEPILRQSEPTLGSILWAMLSVHALRAGKARWMEKTPIHLLSVREIRAAFPTARVVRIVRDPRDVALSLMHVPWWTGSFPEAVEVWRYYDDQSRAFFVRDGHSYTLRFEDLLQSPADALARLCDFLGELFETTMLDTSGSWSRIVRPDEPWKSAVAGPVQQSRAFFWKSQLTREQQIEADAILGELASAYGYEVESEARARTA
jgi:hypothetical protein